MFENRYVHFEEHGRYVFAEVPEAIRSGGFSEGAK
jgi:hypothetical protein